MAGQAVLAPRHHIPALAGTDWTARLPLSLSYLPGLAWTGLEWCRHQITPLHLTPGETDTSNTNVSLPCPLQEYQDQTEEC